MSKIAVKCSTTGEKNKVIEFVRGAGSGYASDRNTEECINLETGNNCDEGFYIREGYTIIPFSQFEKEYPGVKPTLTEQEAIGKIFVAKVDKANGIPCVNKGDKVRYDGCDRCTVLKNNDSGWSMSYFANDWQLEGVPKTPRFKFKVGDEVNYINSKVTAASNGLEGGWLSSSDVTHRMVESCHHSEVVGNCYKIGALYVSEVGLALKPQKLAEPPNPNTTEQWTPKVGEWAVIVPEKFKGSFYKNVFNYAHFAPKDAFKVTELRDNGLGAKYKDKFIHVNGYNHPIDVFRKALPHEIPSLTNESLLEEAKRRYPVGTKFIGIYNQLDLGRKEVCEVVEGNHYQDGSDIYVDCKRPAENVKSAGTYIYYKSQWAEIIEEPKTHPEYVECVQSWHPVAWTTGKIYKTNTRQEDYPRHLSLKDNEGIERHVNRWDELPSGFKPSTREAYERQEGIGQANSVGLGASEQVSGLGGSRDFLVGGKNGLLNVPDYHTSLTMMTPKQVEDMYGIKFAEPVDLRFDGGKINFKKSSSTTQPSPKITVKSHEEFKITISKPKQIKL